MAAWVKVDRLEEVAAVGYGDGGWGDMQWGGSVGTTWQKIEQSTDTWIKTDRAE
jgi:hypothetical protein